MFTLTHIPTIICAVPNMLFIGYYRVSTHRQGQSGLGLEAQRDAVHRHVAGQAGAELINEFIEVESGTKAARPVLAETMAECRRRRATLVIAKLDRLARNVAFVSTLLDSKVEFVACDAPHATRMMLQILSVFAEHEARMISERTKAALAAAKARGVVLGCHGKQLAADNRAAADTFAAQMREPIVRLLGSGCVRLRDVAHGLNEAGYVTREGSKWGPTTVQRVLRRLDLRTPAMIVLEAA